MKLLVSVRDALEARNALAGGADWIDLKEPLAGPLGAVSRAIAHAAVAAIDNRCPISAALGELNDWPMSMELLSIPEIRVVKLGLSHCGPDVDWQARWLAVRETCSHQGKQLAAVVYADWQQAGSPQPEDVIKCASRAGAKYLLIDTFHKHDLSSTQILGHDLTARLLQLARQGGLINVLAGSLCEKDLPILAQWPVDVVAVRGVLCTEDRNSTLDFTKVRSFRSHLDFVCKDANALNSCLTTCN